MSDGRSGLRDWLSRLAGDSGAGRDVAWLDWFGRREGDFLGQEIRSEEGREAWLASQGGLDSVVNPSDVVVESTPAFPVGTMALGNVGPDGEFLMYPRRDLVSGVPEGRVAGQSWGEEGVEEVAGLLARDDLGLNPQFSDPGEGPLARGAGFVGDMLMRGDEARSEAGAGAVRGFMAGERAIEGFAANALRGQFADPGSLAYDWDLTLGEAYGEAGLPEGAANVLGTVQSLGLPSVLDAVPGLSTAGDIARVAGESGALFMGGRRAVNLDRDLRRATTVENVVDEYFNKAVSRQGSPTFDVGDAGFSRYDDTIDDLQYQRNSLVEYLRDNQQDIYNNFPGEYELYERLKLIAPDLILETEDAMDIAVGLERSSLAVPTSASGRVRELPVEFVERSRGIFQNAGTQRGRFYELPANQEAAELFSQGMNLLPPGMRKFVTTYEGPEILEGMQQGNRYYMTEQGAGFAIGADGEFMAVFNAGPERGVARDMVRQGIEEGATHLYAFDADKSVSTVNLPELYGSVTHNGRRYEITERMPWNDEYAPKDWDYDRYGRPEFVKMELVEVGE